MSEKVSPRIFAASAAVAFVAIAALVVTGAAPPHGTVAAAAPKALATIVVSPVVPTDLATAAPAASLDDAAKFAWNEFFALNWPAARNRRDTPALNCAFADPRLTCQGPLVWETFRGKAEIFPGQPSFTSTVTPPGYNPNDPRYGYDTPPNYTNVYPFPVGQCPNPSAIVEPPAYLNIDETDQITLDNMFAGSGPSTPPPGSPFNSAPQLVRFLAKANHVEYDYVAKNKWWGLPDNDPNPSTGSPAPFAGPQMETAAYVTNPANFKQPPAGSPKLIGLPFGTIEIKAGLRLLTPQEAGSGKFFMARGRYYENANPNQNLNPCWYQATFGLVALHIIHKTPTAPYMVYATFEQTDNIKTASGTPVEDVDGRVVATQPCAQGQSSPCPTTPLELLLQPTPQPSSSATPSVVLTPAAAAYCTKPQKQLYFLEEQNGTPTNGYICVNRRENDIPPTIVNANALAHRTLAQYLTAHKIGKTPFQFYKLVNVQYQPIDKNYAGPYQAAGSNPGTCANPACYHLANIVVETDRSLQVFSGGLNPGIQTDYNAYLGAPVPPVIHSNVYYAAAGAHGPGKGYNMGGCMGCHGSQGLLQGGDFSVILARGATTANAPEAPSISLPPPTATLMGARHAPYGAKRSNRPVRNRHLVLDRAP